MKKVIFMWLNTKHDIATLKVNSFLDRKPVLFISSYVKFFQTFPNLSKSLDLTQGHSNKIQYSQNQSIFNSVENIQIDRRYVQNIS